MKSMYGNKCHSAIQAISEGDVFISDSSEKVNVFNDYFVNQANLSNNDSAEIPFLPRLSWTPCVLSLQVKKWFVTFYHLLTYQSLVATTA